MTASAPPESARPRGASELSARVLSALVLAGLALISAWFGGVVLALFYCLDLYLYHKEKIRRYMLSAVYYLTEKDSLLRDK